jgi:hypothetical protein
MGTGAVQRTATLTAARLPQLNSHVCCSTCAIISSNFGGLPKNVSYIFACPMTTPIRAKSLLNLTPRRFVEASSNLYPIPGIKTRQKAIQPPNRIISAAPGNTAESSSDSFTN